MYQLEHYDIFQFIYLIELTIKLEFHFLNQIALEKLFHHRLSVLNPGVFKPSQSLVITLCDVVG